MKSILLASAAAIGLLGFGTESADAQWGYRSGYYRNYDGHRGYHSYGHRSYYRPHYDWHDTSHYDYHAPSIRRHGNHYHYQPGHYDYHRQGHWDRH